MAPTTLISPLSAMCLSTGSEVRSAVDHVADVRLACRVDILADSGFDCRTDRGDYRLDVAFGTAFGGHDIPCRDYRATSLVSEHHDQRHVQVLDGVLDAADGVVIYDISGLTNHEQVAQPLVEENFWAGP